VKRFPNLEYRAQSAAHIRRINGVPFLVTKSHGTPMSPPAFLLNTQQSRASTFLRESYNP